MSNQSTNSAAGCRFCATPLQHTFLDLGMSPLCEDFLTHEELNAMEPFYPLYAWVCDKCFLVQLQEYVTPDKIFDDYAYFSSYSDSWLRHAAKYSDMVTERFGLGAESLVVEIASNDGYLLKNFVEKKIPALGIEPAANVAEVAVEKGIETIVKFFGRATAQELVDGGRQADLLLGNNVLAHVPDINDFVGGQKILLKPSGVVTMEFPHLARLMEHNQYDTIYHEHFSYLSFTTVEKIFAEHGLTLFDVEELPSHGGSLRIFARHAENAALPVTERVEALRAAEAAAGFTRLEHYLDFTKHVEKTKRDLLTFLIKAREDGKSTVAYGAPGKGNTLLNYCGIRTDLVEYAVDRNPYKHGRFTPGTHIPIFDTDKIKATRPDYVLILPWNLKREITEQHAYISEWGGKFVVPIPEVSVVDAPSPVASKS